jgi:hypothetical protein
MKPTVKRRMRRVLLLVAAYALLVVALAVAHEQLDSHLERELTRVGDNAARDYVKADKFPLHISLPVEPRATDTSRERSPNVFDSFVFGAADAERHVRDVAKAAHVALPADIDWEASKSELDAVIEKAKNAWLSDHRVEVMARDVVNSSGLALTKGMPNMLKTVTIYLSLPFKIALGIGFGIALGAWIVKRAGLNDIWR